MDLWHTLVQRLLLLLLLLHPPSQPLLLKVPLDVGTHECVIIVVVVSGLVDLGDQVRFIEDSKLIDPLQPVGDGVVVSIALEDSSFVPREMPRVDSDAVVV